MNPNDTVRRPDQNPHGDRTCPVCGEGHVTTFAHRDTFEYGTGESAVTLHVDLPVRRCHECDFEFLDYEGERLKHDVICRHLGVLTSTEVRSIRKRYGMSRSSFADVTGLGEATLNRWENGVVIQNPANDRYLRLLAMPDVFGRLTNLPSRPLIPLQEPDPNKRSRVHNPAVSNVKLHSRESLRKTVRHLTKSVPDASANSFSGPNDRWDSRLMSDMSKPHNVIPMVYKRTNTVKKAPTPAED